MEDSRRLIKLKGSSFVLPDIMSNLNGWAADISPHLAWLRVEVENRLNWIVSQRFEPSVAARVFVELQAADFGFFGATWWPKVDSITLRALTFLSIWLFLWDDEIDTTDGEYTSDLEKAEAYRNETLDFVYQALELDEALEKHTPRIVKPSNVLIYSFISIDDGMFLKSDISQRKRLYSEIEFFIKACELEQQRRLSSVTPSIEAYMACRMGTSAVRVGVAAWECCSGFRGNANYIATFQQETHIAMLYEYTNIIISVVNDIVSIKKEIHDESFHSLIPLLWLSSSNEDLQVAVDQAVKLIGEAKGSFSIAEKQLLCGYDKVNVQQNQEETKLLHKFIEVCKTSCTGNLLWSLKTKRYGLCLIDVARECVVQL